LLDRLIGHVRPALLCLGPLYKASLSGSDRGEQVAAETTAALDRIRERHGCAMWLEHHAPMAQNGSRTLRPIDSGLWSRWPEFGITLERDGENHPNQFRLGRFRRDREPRCWPDTLAWGPEWPFEFGWDQGMPGGLHDGVWAVAS
jgi:replicative DNA helicase